MYTPGYLCPPIQIEPRSTSQNRAIRLHRVVFPEPLGPMMAVVVRSGIVTLTFFRIKNPYAGRISVPEVGEIIMDDENAKGEIIKKHCP